MTNTCQQSRNTHPSVLRKLDISIKVEVDDASDSGRTIELHGLINKTMRIPMARRICRSITNNLPEMTHLSLWVICLNNPIKTAELLSRPGRQRFPKHRFQQRDSLQRTLRCCQTSLSNGNLDVYSSQTVYPRTIISKSSPANDECALTTSTSTLML